MYANHVWQIDPSAYAVMRKMYRQRDLHEGTSWLYKPSADLKEAHDAINSGEDAYAAIKRRSVRGESKRGVVAVMPLVGSLEHRQSLFGMLFGGTGTESFRSLFKQLVRDEEVKAIVLDIDSPGGEALGTPELAETIYQARELGKPIVSLANTKAASAAYHIGSAAHGIFSIGSGQVGSVGALMIHMSDDAALEDEGIEKTIFHASKSPFKSELWTSLSEEAKEHAQKYVDQVFERFLTDLMKFHEVSEEKVLDDFGKGRMKLAKDALQSGMIAGTTTRDELIALLATDALTLEGGRLSMNNISKAADVDFQIDYRVKVAGIEIPKKVSSLAESEYAQPLLSYADNIRRNYNRVWSKGCSDLESEQAYRFWAKSRMGVSNAAISEWIAKREEWAKEHADDELTIENTMTMLKWGVVSSKGWDEMKKVIDAEIEVD